MQTKANIAAISVLAFFLSACASIQQGTLEDSQSITITSTPSKLKIFSNLTLICETPCSVRGKDLIWSSFLRVRNDNNLEKKFKIDRSFNEDIVGNIIYGGGPGVLIDIATGNSGKYPKSVHINFDQL